MKLTERGVTHFVGKSAPFTHIFAVLQHLIDARNAFFNGDWLFLNVVLGLKSASSTHPCPICIVTHHNYLRSGTYRTAAHKHSQHKDQPALLAIPSDRIVPTPLHVFLGLSNRIIGKVYPRLFGEQAVFEAVKRIKTLHSAGCTGLSDLWALNGQEISKWVKKKCSQTLPAKNNATKATHSILSGWLVDMHHFLLHAKDWLPADIEKWRGVVDDIKQHWVPETQIDPFPKLHMMLHTVDFAERYRFLGRASEAPIEAFHPIFNDLFHKQHRNMSSNTGERMRRCLANTSTRAMRPMLKRKAAEADLDPPVARSLDPPPLLSDCYTCT